MEGNLQRCRETFELAQAALFDFDRTAGMTHESGPGIVNVAQAYDTGVEVLYGLDGLERYRQAGGMKSRSPGEIVLAANPDMHRQALEEETKKLIRIKLDILVEQIGTPLPGGGCWPRPTDGFVDCWQEIDRLRLQGQLIDRGIISAGHERFIVKVFDMWGLTQPDFMITDEVMRAHRNPKELARRVKPSTFPMALAHQQWLKMYGYSGVKDGQLLYDHQIAIRSKKRMHYIGDDIVSDGEFAARSSVGFDLLDPDNAAPTWRRVRQKLVQRAQRA